MESRKRAQEEQGPQPPCPAPAGYKWETAAGIAPGGGWMLISDGAEKKAPVAEPPPPPPPRIHRGRPLKADVVDGIRNPMIFQQGHYGILCYDYAENAQPVQLEIFNLDDHTDGYYVSFNAVYQFPDAKAVLEGFNDNRITIDEQKKQVRALSKDGLFTTYEMRRVLISEAQGAASAYLQARLARLYDVVDAQRSGADGTTRIHFMRVSDDGGADANPLEKLFEALGQKRTRPNK